MTDIELQELKKKLAGELHWLIKKMIEKKGLNASYLGGSVGTSLRGEDSLYVELLVDHGKSERILRTEIHFINNENELFDENSFVSIDRRAGLVGKTIDPLLRAELRVLWIVYRICIEVYRGLDTAVENCAKGINDQVFVDIYDNHWEWHN